MAPAMPRLRGCRPLPSLSVNTARSAVSCPAMHIAAPKLLERLRSKVVLLTAATIANTAPPIAVKHNRVSYYFGAALNASAIAGNNAPTVFRSAATAGAGSSMWKTLLQLLLLFVLCCSAWSAPACSSAALQQLTVSSRAQALALAIYTSCEGGNFEVKWVGVVELSNVIAVGANTTLEIIGADQQATISGSNATSLFEVAANGSLHLQGLTLSDGFVNDSISTGGAITLQSHASLTVVACTFERNAAVFGGSIYIADKDFTAADATLSAGLVTLQNSSFSNCAAAESGGVVWLGNARQLITSGSVFEQNRCTWGG
eukprot:10796-Heterococcus_DN1.PRE.1